MSYDRILEKVRQWRRPWASGSEPLEIHRAILEDIEAQSVAAGGGRRVFPFDRVEVRILAATPEEKVRLEAVVQEVWNLPVEVPERLRARGARVPEGLAVIVDVTAASALGEAADAAPEAKGRHYALTFSKSAARRGTDPGPVKPAAPAGQAEAAAAAVQGGSEVAAPWAQKELGATTAAGGGAVGEGLGGVGAGGEVAAGAGEAAAEVAPQAHPAVAVGAGSAAGAPGERAARGGRPRLRLTVLKGKAVQEAYSCDADRLYLGRLEEVLDGAGRVRRRNDVAFLEEGDLNQTVSREHARVAWEPEGRAFWLRDEGSSSGTVIFRAGRSIEVSRHDRRGVRLESGDEVYLGRAAVRVEIGEPGA